MYCICDMNFFTITNDEPSSIFRYVSYAEEKGRAGKQLQKGTIHYQHADRIYVPAGRNIILHIFWPYRKFPCEYDYNVYGRPTELKTSELAAYCARYVWP